MKKQKFTDAHILIIMKLSAEGVPITDICRDHGISIPTYHRLCNSTKDTRTMSREQFKELVAETRRLKKALASESLKYAISQKGYEQLEISSKERKLLAVHAVDSCQISIRLACEIFNISETSYRYRSKHSVPSKDKMPLGIQNDVR